MGNKLSCSCAPLIRKAYRYEDSQWQTSRRRDGHLLRLWAEVFHVSSGPGTIKWQQVSEDLVPVNITCIQDSPECVFHITAYNSQVDKILDVRLVQPGTRIGQASESFVYWKDPKTNDTWGLNFTSSIDAKQFKECCSPSFKFSRKASSSYSLKLDQPNKQKIKTKRKPLSTPASPSRSREPQCTCMTAEQYARLRAQDPRYRSSTLPRAQTRATETDSGTRSDKVTAATSSTSLYDNVASGKSQSVRSTGTGDTIRSTRDRGIQQQTDSGTMTTPSGKPTSQNHVGSQVSQPQVSEDKGEQTMEKCRSEGTQAGGTLSQMQMQTMHKNQANKSRDHHHILTSTRSMDYDMDLVRESHHHNNINNNNNNIMNNMINNIQNNNTIINNRRNKSMSKSTDDMRESQRDLNLDSNTLKRMLKPMTSNESPMTSPEMTRRRYASNYYNSHHQPHHQHQYRDHHTNNRSVMSDVEGTPRGHHKQIITDRDRTARFSGSRSSHEIGRGYQNRDRGLYLELERNGGPPPDMSPPSDNVLFDNQCYATTPSSSNGNSDLDQPTSNYRSHQTPSAPGSPTSRLLHEYEMHLRNTLAKGMDAESYSLHTFEALLSQSMENLEFAESLPSSTPRSPYTSRRRPGSSASSKSSTLPLSHRLSIERPTSRAARDREGYYSDRNELIRERERERERERGYLSDHNSSSRCASCLGESSRAQWFRHSDGWRSGSSTFGSGTGSVTMSQSSMSGHKRSPWDSLPSLRHDSRDDSGYKSTRADSFEQRSSLFDRQDSLRSDYISDRESRYGIVHQASIESADSRLCYLTSSEVSPFYSMHGFSVMREENRD
ncbi:UNVERIFIED_CONTAM: hypothetical protein PYX00_009308 [Menopon gallinae]|uniref:WH1 domain-containing protein n=1 Tax=Menopon gallinae TaxID=328185 RepID=A0AAW2HAK6_9NEOP